MARQQRVDWGDGEGVGELHADKDEKCFNNWGRRSQDNGIAEEANDRLCPLQTPLCHCLTSPSQVDFSVILNIGLEYIHTGIL